MNLKSVKIEELKIGIATVLWTAVMAMGITGSVWNEIELLFWSGITALIACCWTGFLIAMYAARSACHEERVDMEHLALLAIQAYDEERGLRAVPHPN